MEKFFFKFIILRQQYTFLKAFHFFIILRRQYIFLKAFLKKMTFDKASTI